MLERTCLTFQGNAGGISVLQKTNMEKIKDNIVLRIKYSIREFDETAVNLAITEGITEGIDPVILAEEGCIAAMKEIGDMFESDKILLVQLLAAAKVMKAGMEILIPEIEKIHTELKQHNKAVISPQNEDEYSMKMSIIEMMLMINDFDVIELRKNESIIDFIEKDITFSNISTDCKKQLNEVIHSHPGASILQLCEVLDGMC